MRTANAGPDREPVRAAHRTKVLPASGIAPVDPVISCLGQPHAGREHCGPKPCAAPTSCQIWQRKVSANSRGCSHAISMLPTSHCCAAVAVRISRSRMPPYGGGMTISGTMSDYLASSCKDPAASWPKFHRAARGSDGPARTNVTETTGVSRRGSSGTGWRIDIRTDRRQRCTKGVET